MNKASEAAAKPTLDYPTELAKAVRLDAAYLRAVGSSLLTAEMRGEWPTVARVRADLVESALALEALADRLEARR
jgi:hypothetical protein